VRFLAVRRLELAVNHREQGHDRNAELYALLGHRQQQVQTQALHAWHGRDSLTTLLAVQYEHGVNQVMDAECVLAYQIAGELVAAQPAGPAHGIGGIGCHGENCARFPGKRISPQMCQKCPF
jgi:hypothetical protein